MPGLYWADSRKKLAILKSDSKSCASENPYVFKKLFCQFFCKKCRTEMQPCKTQSEGFILTLTAMHWRK